ncbi:hypothetical protein A3E65_02965 [Candidatus Kaiserbacteria bacterium RIFCSPHIGHO2_12_FULL_56_13]|uniref:IPT/TIG domain-containing protein n=2 Tax=Candidatus Kaiseribacteriota TaxID=1752734 RepID=A0A1F6E2T0_9BACT|nr:MAG: hypothetical protein A3C95_02075 [Candidatus Kaiserbacteria bacterium RIFCSPHIGHO2_02_FULL_56_30]OGG72327.1 MAG: hypothetical protein A3E65_02965 [Candidatus Kaiserbacteria bacterium RIFCSPHIGHO2_12_FULL_56_13]
MAGRIITVVVFVALVVYGLIEAFPLILGPSLTIDSPKSGETISGGVVTMSGHVTRTTALTLNGDPLLPDDEGSFSEVLAYAPGTSILTFMASDRFGRTITMTRTIYLSE